MTLRPLAIAALLLVGTAAQAWNASGHMVIAAIAKANLTPSTRLAVDRLLQSTAMNSSTDFVAVASWADEVRNQRKETGPWHFRDTYFRTDGKPAVNKPDADNAVVEILRFEKILGDKAAPAPERADALRFLIHLVGDLHQPLHASALESESHPKGDRGGNDYKIVSSDEKGPKNLHQLWDGGAGLFVNAGETTPIAAEAEARALMATIPASSLRGVNDLDVEHWSNESVSASKKTVYSTPEGGTPSDAYMMKARTLAAQRATLAGYRLARLLNGLLGDEK